MSLMLKISSIFVGLLILDASSIAAPHELDVNGFHYSQNKPPDQETLAIFRGASHVETYRVDGSAAFTASPPPPVKDRNSQQKSSVAAKPSMIEGLPITAHGPTYGKAFAGRLSAVVSNPKSYAQEGFACLMVPGVVFRVRSGKTFADVVLCFRCSQIVVNGYDQSGQQMSRTSGVMEARDAFLLLAQKAFPKDKELAGP